MSPRRTRRLSPKSMWMPSPVTWFPWRRNRRKAKPRKPLRTRPRIKFLLPVLFSLAVAVCRADGPYHLIKEIPVGGDGGWDGLIVDSTAQRLYVSHGTRVVVI